MLMLEMATSVSSANSELRGSALAIILYEVAEQIQIEQMRDRFGGRRVGPRFKHAAPEYVRFQRPPVVENLEPVSLASGERVDAQIKYYDYGVVSVLFECPFAGEWDAWIRLASRWMASDEFERQAQQLARQRLEQHAPGVLVKPYTSWLAEDYFVFHISEIPASPTAGQLLAECGAQITGIVRGETERLSDAERAEVLHSRLSYYPQDLVVVGWHGAFLYDTAAGAQTTIELLEYANSQLLEFRHYDQLLTTELEGVYQTLDRDKGAIRRWRLARKAARLQTVALDVTELAERADNAIKFLSDMFSARLYRLAAAKVGVFDYKNLVHQKLRTADELYRFMIEQFQQARAFVLELMVVVILIIELVYLFRGK